MAPFVRTEAVASEKKTPGRFTFWESYKNTKSCETFSNGKDKATVVDKSFSLIDGFERYSTLELVSRMKVGELYCRN